ncbi:hypothetical protein QTP70_004019 [Hemibagrus guttatus]|uniref:Ig-like domain-containing protein n=1 Tax=Hemibagrus guttatus TaxID=175788 RepID=A0AAE0UHK7_9TELE|nr:hypothetical protein QTP70_004019 [Hemibagrus guttatus]
MITNSNQEHKTQEFSLRSVRNEHSGSYTCRGWRSVDSQSSEISDAVALTVSNVAETVVSVSPSSWLTEGDSVALSCEIKHSSTGWTFSWYTDASYRDSRGFIRISLQWVDSPSPRDESCHREVVCKLGDGVAVVGGGALVCEGGVEQAAQYTALWEASADAENRRCMMTHSNSLAVTGQEAIAPHAGGVWKSHVPQFVNQFER